MQCKGNGNAMEKAMERQWKCNEMQLKRQWKGNGKAMEIAMEKAMGNALE